MRTLALPCLLAAFCFPASADVKKSEPKCAGDFGTSIAFHDTPKHAAEAATKLEKLLFVLHVSGHFEDPGLT